jgi:hypothetical protein
MPELRDPAPTQRKKPTGGAKSVMRLEPPPTPPRYTADGVWRPASPGGGDRPGERDTRGLPKPAVVRRRCGW